MELSLKEELEEHWKQEAAWGECGNVSNASCFEPKSKESEMWKGEKPGQGVLWRLRAFGKRVQLH